MYGASPELFYGLLILAVLWDIFWTGIGLWKSARNDQKYWFLAMLILSTVGILPIIYIYAYQKGKKGI